ncbi:hypothetical protein CRE_22940 [Caenorhabditis remanei]|uniref:Uncharacterized protein n=1 Tax=Caenorhabditis remanei TaxID=31234 RepID=E3MW73_CAERE|nr:hypothetical protein CRE_22940 [Caenorhabditis remanei]
MNELVYREDLEQLIANQLAKSNGCPDPSIVKRDGYHIILNYEGTLKYTAITQSGRTVLAATTTTCPENGETVVGIIVDGADTEPVRGAAGTHCSVGRTPNAIGLCALVGNGRRGYVRKDIDVKIPTTIIETGIRVPKIWFPERVPDVRIPEIPDDIKILDLPDVFPW